MLMILHIWGFLTHFNVLFLFCKMHFCRVNSEAKSAQNQMSK